MLSRLMRCIETMRSDCEIMYPHPQSLLTITIHCQQVLQRGPMDALVLAIIHDAIIIGPVNQLEHCILGIE